jgi:hypothetical protein
MSALDPRIEAVRERYGLARDDFWELPQKKGTWVAKHAALEVAAVKANIRFDMPVIVEANGGEGVAAVCVQGEMEGRFEWSLGEASPKNNKNAYPWAMAEKRAKDRVILKLIGIHGLIYSEEEADDFKASRPAPAVPANGHEALKQQLVASTAGPPPATALDANGKPFKHGMRIEPEMRNLWTELKNELDACLTLAQLAMLWASKPFQEEFRKIKPDWQTQLVEHKELLKTKLSELAGYSTLGEHLDRMEAQEP